ncbi:Holliday junction DNA helicase RuvA [Candidatus Uhrbacteria bacterium RIFCSPHIGHO2_12_FULL_60_25]|uniref:Holliday junction branch migration complex subunit RuvA n=1 Tax=Candidatus Uhrbacteria bacterium RIFCSPHIGHO2_12_FULL_60_25 TaxID=1802399 RepID=A0A1F7UKY7_9BACT|nr:MAG: Holliday junction DNA helicase RuvA [Candidatus Uhrbacteria bacterium RIFCSPHIGHO2_02_FULL_60_44]OGL78404.1 MAG: Holliday junction DNA helicase RuvA [Candidatus Uhrbacteria bacterium RIFCSPHIGHO2_12_FULL_60_25]
MIASLRGKVTALTPLYAVFDVQGVGYRVNAAPNTLTRLSVGEDALLHIHDHVREDARDLYGFLSADELALFERLIAVSGVGPKAGMSILSVGTAETVKRAIMSGDLAALTSAPGIGTKIAQKIVLELKGQLIDVDVAMGPDREVVDALVSLGYSSHQARTALKNVPVGITDVSDRVREALRSLSN